MKKLFSLFLGLFVFALWNCPMPEAYASMMDTFEAHEETIRIDQPMKTSKCCTDVESGENCFCLHQEKEAVASIQSNSKKFTPKSQPLAFSLFKVIPANIDAPLLTVQRTSYFSYNSHLQTRKSVVLLI